MKTVLNLAAATILLIGGSLATAAWAANSSSSTRETAPASDADTDTTADSDAATTADTPELVYGTSFDLMLKALEENDFKGKLEEDDEGDPIIRSADEDEPFAIHFYGCTDHKDCTYIQFTSGWNLKNGITLTKISEWNKKKVWGQAYIDDDKDPWVALSVNLDGGVTYDNFSDTVDWWKVVLKDFEEHIGWNND